jgi:hypothetical protein
MRHLFSLLLAGLLALVGANASNAALVPFVGQFFLGVGTLPGITVQASGMANINGSAGGLHISSLNLVGGSFKAQVSVPVPNAAPISGIVLAGGTITQMTHLAVPKSVNLTFNIPTGSVSNAAANFAGMSGGSGGGTMPINGVALVCLFDVCSGAPSANLVVPLTPVGQGGTVFAVGAVSITAIGAPWVAGTAAVATVTAMGFAHGAESGASTTNGASGVLSLVVPVFVSTSLPTFPVVPVFTRLTLHFIPEPGTLLLLGSGIAGLAVLGSRRLRG